MVHDKWYTEDSESLKNKPGLVSRNGTYYARVRVPALLVGLLQKHEIKISLRTKNLNEARAKLPAALVEIHKQLAAATKVADAVSAPAEEVRRGTLEQIARTWFEPRWRATGESLWKPIPAGAAAKKSLCNIDPELARLSLPDEVTFGEDLYAARGLLAAAGYSEPSGSSVEVLAQFMVRGEIECLNRSRRFLVDGRLYDAIEDPLYRAIGGSGEVLRGQVFDQDRQPVDAHAEVDRIAMQVDLQPFVEPEHGSLPSIWITVASSSTLASPRSNSTPFDRRTFNESAINDVSGGGSTGKTAGAVDGAVTTGTNACASLAGTRRAGPGMSIDTPSITSGSGLVGVCSVCC